MLSVKCICGEIYHADDSHVGRFIQCRCGELLQVSVPVPPIGWAMADIYRGSRISKLLGLVSFLLLVSTVASVVSGHWLIAACVFVGSLLVAYGGYRAAGDRHNPELAKAEWEKRQKIDLVSDQVASWPAKVEAIFDMLERESGGDYAGALTGFKMRSIPQPVQAAYAEALRSPSRDSWNKLKQALLENQLGPPQSSRPKKVFVTPLKWAGIALVTLFGITLAVGMWLRVTTVAGPETTVWADQDRGDYFSGRCLPIAAQAGRRTAPVQLKEARELGYRPNEECVERDGFSEDHGSLLPYLIRRYFSY